MATKVIHVSDLSGREAADDELGRLVILDHPGYADLPVTLEALPEEVAGLRETTRYVSLEWVPPGERHGERVTVSLDDFNLLAGPGRVDDAIQDALIAKHRARGRSAGGGAGVETPRRRGRTRQNYASLEHAGEPHRGRITEAEKELVRDNLDKINQRLRASGIREIDPGDPAMRQRYGL